MLLRNITEITIIRMKAAPNPRCRSSTQGGGQESASIPVRMKVLRGTGGTDREKVLADDGIQPQMAVLFQRRYQSWQNRLETLAANAVGCFPEHDEGFPHGFILDPSSNGRSIGSDGAFAAKQSNRMLAVTAGHGHELVQVSGLFQFADMLGALT